MRAVVFDGVVLGLQFGLLGVGLVYGNWGVLNLAQGQLAVLGAIVVALRIDAGSAVVPAVLTGLVVAGTVGLTLDLTLMRPVYRRTGEDRVLLGLLLMLGVAFIIDGVLVWRYPIEALTLRIGGEPVDVLGVRMRTGSLLASAIALGVGATRPLPALRRNRQGGAPGDPGRGGRPALRRRARQRPFSVCAEWCPGGPRRRDALDDVPGHRERRNRLHDPGADRGRRRRARQRLARSWPGSCSGSSTP